MLEARSPVVVVAGVAKHFGQRAVFDEIALKVAAGNRLLLAGPNGSGKSTLLRLVAGLLPATAGTGSVLGCPLGKLSREARNAIGYLPQRAALYPALSAYENLRLRAALAGLVHPAVAVRAALQAIGLTQRQHERLASLSGGWVRRVEIAALLLHQPRLLLLDEPTTGLDTEAVETIWTRLLEFSRRGGALIYSSHDPAALIHATGSLELGVSHAR